MESEKDPEKMNDKYLSDIILNFMIAGKDTSANTLSWFFYMLCKNPLIQEKVAQELRDVVGNQEGVVIDEFVVKITDATLEQMHYLHATLTETLRLYPAVPAVCLPQISTTFHISKLRSLNLHFLHGIVDNLCVFGFTPRMGDVQRWMTFFQMALD